MCEKSVLVFTRAASLIKVVPYENDTNMYACMTAKRTTEIYPGILAYIIDDRFGKVNGNMQKYQNVWISQMP